MVVGKEVSKTVSKMNNKVTNEVTNKVINKQINKEGDKMIENHTRTPYPYVQTVTESIGNKTAIPIHINTNFASDD